MCPWIVEIDDLLGADPITLRLSLQPYITLLEMDFPLDKYSLVVRRALRNDASNAAEMDRKTRVTAKRSPSRENQKSSSRYIAIKTRFITNG